MINLPIHMMIDAHGRGVIPKAVRTRLRIEDGSEIIIKVIEVDRVKV